MTGKRSILIFFAALLLPLAGWAQGIPGGGGIRPTNAPGGVGWVIEASSVAPLVARWASPTNLQASATNAPSHEQLVTASNSVVTLLIANDTTTSNGVLTASRASDLVTSNALVTYANSVTNASIVRQTELTAASNAVIAYANGVTNASLVRQTELTTASNTLVTATSNNVRVAAGNAITVTSSGSAGVMTHTVAVGVIPDAQLSNSVTLIPATGASTVVKPAAGSVSVTNLAGLIHKTSTSPIELNANAAAFFSVTNRVTANTTVVFTNTSDGQEISVILLGEAAGGAARTITLVPQLGHLVADLDTFGVALATSSTLTLTNGNAVEINWRVARLNGTNIAGRVSRQYAF